ncbi:uncharacterized protein LOC135146407 [Zophobas morio]|uniref:uncharacterized protein LOC135146407 n=1 Tax=Zophobas morio TaxID=2755281 RepID=UPI003082A16C
MNLNLKIFEKIKEFIFQSDESSRFLELPKQEIPTVILSTGLNLVDHKLILTLLCDYLKNHEHLHLVRLISSENPSLTAIVRNVLLQVLACEHEKEFQYDLKASKREINYLSSWYKKRYFEAKNVIPIVILFEDLQTFSVQAVCEFLTQCSIMQPDVKFVFVFNVPLLQNVVQKYPGHILSLLATEKFGLHPPHVYLDDIIEKVCINPAYRFFLHSSSFAYLLDRFTSYELCFSTFTESYKTL